VRKLVEPPLGAQRNPVAVAQRLGRAGEITMNNPVMIAGRGGAVHGVYCVEYARCFYTRSDDDGRTWGEPVEVTGAFEGLRPAYDWHVIATGPGHGVQLRTGRLLVPVWLSTGEGRGAHRPSAVATIYSDDDGRTWRAGSIVVKHPALNNPSESAAVELSDGRVMLNIRHEGRANEPGANGATWRAVTTSPDGATGWAPVRLDKAQAEPVCMAGLLRLDRGAGKSATILFSNPQPPGGGRQRRNLTVRLSDDDGATWPVARVIDFGPAGYSDLAESTDGTVLCLYERGVDEDGKLVQSRSLTLARFDLDWLRQGDRKR
jgi:sialidase-1